MGDASTSHESSSELCPRMGISDSDFKEAAKDLIDYVIKYYNNLDRQAFPDVKPGFMRARVPETAPNKAEGWEALKADIDKVVMDGNTHWQSSRFFSYFPCASSYPAILADILSDACACIGFTWVSSPSCTELETVVMDWLAKALGLPECFRHEGKGPGCGVIQGTASEATIVTMIAARTKIIQEYTSKNSNLTKHDVLSRLVAYTSKYSHSSVERAGLLAMVELRQLPVDENISVRGKVLQQAIEEDKAAGKIPFYVCVTLGTTDCCTFDNLEEIGKICEKEGIWCHVDAAYAGSSFICPEFRHRMKGVELATSFNFNPHKWLMVNFDCSALWVKHSTDLINSMHVNPIYLRHNEEKSIDYRHWQIPLGRRFRSLKIWFVLRLIGLEGLRNRIREDVRLARLFESFVRSDPRFQVLFSELGLVCFRLVKFSDNPERNIKINKDLQKQIDNSRDIHLIGSEVEGKYFLRVATGPVGCDEKAVVNCWQVIQRHTTEFLAGLDN